MTVTHRLRCHLGAFLVLAASRSLLAQQPTVLSGETPVTLSNPGRQLALGDLDGDGNVDLVVLRVDGTLDLFLGDGKGTFTLRDSQRTFSDSSQIVIGNTDNDHRDEILVCNRNPNSTTNRTGFSLSRWDGERLKITTLTPLPFAPISSMLLFDYNRDGLKDLCAVLDKRLVMIRNDGNDTFVFSEEIANLGTECRTLASGDIDGDGTPELIAGVSPMLKAFAQGKEPRELLTGSLPWVVSSPVAMVFADLDLDNDQDLVSCEQAMLLVAENDGKGSFPFRYRNELLSVTALAVADFDGEHHPDIAILYSRPAPEQSYFEVQCNFPHSLRVLPRSVTTLQALRAMVTQDFDGDGRADVVVLGGPSGNVLRLHMDPIDQTATHP